MNFGTPRVLRALVSALGSGAAIRERGREFAVAVADQEARPLVLVCQGHDQVPRLLCDPGPIRVRGDAGEMDAATLQLDEEEHVHASQPERLDGEEVTLEDPGGLSA